MKYDAFISYRRKNGFEMAQLIRDRLKEKGINCFLDLEEDRAGKFDEKLIEAISESSNFIIILPRRALDRCVNEDDWVRKELLAAVEMGKTIIPVEYSGFYWPKKLNDKLPKEIADLEHQQRILASQEYFPYMIEKIISYMTDVKVENTGNIEKPPLYIESSRFILDKLKSVDNFVCVDMAFHAGGEWRRNADMVNTLYQLQKEGYKVRVMVNSADAVESVCKHMRQPMKKYVDFNLNIQEWIELSKEYPESIEVRILNVPLLHRLYIVRGENSGSVNVKYYSYGNYTPEKDFRLTFDSPAPEYELYTQEFDYLWELSEKTK